MNYIKALYQFILRLFKRARTDSVAAYSGHSALFLVISLFPLIMLLLSAVKYTPITQDDLLKTFSELAPPPLDTIIKESINDIFSRFSNLALSITAITLLWSASSCIYSITMGLNRIYNYKETRNYFILRGISLVYTLMFILLLLITLVLMVFGRAIIALLQSYFPIIRQFAPIINILRQIIAFLIILFISNLFYAFIPNHKSRLMFEFPGAVVTAICWYVFSFAYSLYINYFSNISYIYGSLAAAVFLLLWLYFSMYIFFLGAEINQMAMDAGWCFKKRKEIMRKETDDSDG